MRRLLRSSKTGIFRGVRALGFMVFLYLSTIPLESFYI